MITWATFVGAMNGVAAASVENEMQQVHKNIVHCCGSSRGEKCFLPKGKTESKHASLNMTLLSILATCGLTASVLKERDHATRAKNRMLNTMGMCGRLIKLRRIRSKMKEVPFV